MSYEIHTYPTGKMAVVENVSGDNITRQIKKMAVIAEDELGDKYQRLLHRWWVNDEVKGWKSAAFRAQGVTIYVSGDHENVDLYAILDGGGTVDINKPVRVTVVVADAVTIHSDHVSHGAIYSSQSLAVGSSIYVENRGFIYGCHGAGGNGSGFIELDELEAPPTPGLKGGPAITVEYNLHVTTINGTIGGGGGGGGGGGFAAGYVDLGGGATEFFFNGGGGGGGSPGGDPGAQHPHYRGSDAKPGDSGAVGEVLGGDPSTAPTSHGGAGGATDSATTGLAGAEGYGNYDHGEGAAGGAVGNAIELNGAAIHVESGLVNIIGEIIP